MAGVPESAFSLPGRTALPSFERRLPIGRRTFLAILLSLVLALLLQARLALDLAASGRDADHALALARLMTLPPLLTAVLWLLRDRRRLLCARLGPAGLTARIVCTGMATGVLMRAAGWSQVTASGAFGVLEAARDAPARAFGIGVDCPAFEVMAAAVATWLVVVPLTEEIVHRGVVQSYLAGHGKRVAIGGSTLVFALMHEPGTWPWVALMGSLFALQYWNARTLWLPVITHASYDGLIPLDELCLRLSWNPPDAELPLLAVGVPAAAVFASCTFAAFRLARESWVGPPPRRPDPVAGPVTGE